MLVKICFPSPVCLTTVQSRFACKSRGSQVQIRSDQIARAFPINALSGLELYFFAMLPGSSSFIVKALGNYSHCQVYCVNITWSKVCNHLEHPLVHVHQWIPRSVSDWYWRTIGKTTRVNKSIFPSQYPSIKINQGNRICFHLAPALSQCAFPSPRKKPRASNPKQKKFCAFNDFSRHQ